MAIIIKPPVSGGGGGAVDSVNGETGVVVLTTDNIDAGSNADRQYFTSALQTDLDAKALQSDLDTLDGRVDTAESDIDSLQANRLYSNSYYVNDGVNDIQAVHDDAAFGEGDVIFVSSGSYGGSTLSLTKSNFSILPPPTGINSICELSGGRGLTISGASCTGVRVRSLQIEGNTLINGTQGRHLFKSVTFLGTTTITNSTSNFITFEDCEFAGAITIASSVTATIYFVRCSFGGVAISSSLATPTQCLLSDCSGINASQANLVGLAFVGRTGFADNTVSQYTSNAKYVYNLLTGATTTFTGSYSELRDKPTIPSAYTDEQAQDASASLFTSGTHTGISYSYVDGSNKIDSTVSLASFDTDDLTEGATNKYFSDTLARGAFSAGTGITITTGTIATTITQYTDSLAKSASVVDSMAGTQTDQAPSVSSVKSYYTAGTGISLSSGTIASTITQYTDEQAQDQAASLFTSGTHTGISYSYIDASNKIDSTVSLAGFSIDALSDVDTTTSAPSSGQALAWDGSKWAPSTISGGSRAPYTTVSSFPYTITAPASTVVKSKFYISQGASAVTVNLPAIASCDGLEVVIKSLGTGTITIDANSSETIDGALTFALTLQNSSVSMTATSAGWRIE